VFRNAVGIAFHLGSSAPKSAFDVGMTLAAARRLHGLPIYSDPVSDQASTMYGPLVPIVTSWLFQAFGVSNLPGKLLSLAASLAIITLILATTARRDARAWVVGAALLFACNHNVAFYFVEARPDMVACLLAFVALLLFSHFDLRGRAWALIISLPLFVLALLAKQPLAAAAFVPLIAEIGRGGKVSRVRLGRVGVATPPLLAVGVAVLCLRLMDPMAYFYMVTLPAQYHVSLVSAWHSGFELTLMNPALLLGAFDLVFYRGQRDPQTRWWVAGVGVFLATGLFAMAKDGGWWNSLLPFFLASAGFVILQLPRVFAVLRAPLLSRSRYVAASVVLALLLAAVAIRHPGEALSTLAGAIVIQGDVHYQQAVALARVLPGKVLCPEDPTIPLIARGDITRSVFLENDAALWPRRIPAYVDEHIAGARFVIQIRGHLQQLLTDEWLTRLGFTPMVDDRLAGSVYRLWRKVSDG